MNAWSVLAGLLVTVGAGAGAVFQAAPEATLPSLPSGVMETSDDGIVVVVPGVIEVRDGPDGNETDPEGNATAPPANETAEPEPVAEAEPAGNASCSCVFIEDWGDTVGPSEARWSFPVFDSNTRLSFFVDASSPLGLGGSFRVTLLDGAGEVVAEMERSGVEILGGYDILAGELEDPSPGIWALEVKADDLMASYSVSVATGC